MDSSNQEITSTDILREYSDSAAHLKSLDYLYNKKIEYYQKGAELGDTLLVPKPISYSLFDKDRKDITDKTFSTYDLLIKNRYESMVLSARHGYVAKMQEIKEKAEIEDKIEKERAKTLKNSKLYFNFKKDDFNGVEWVTPKTAPRYLNKNGIYCYFQSNDGMASNFRLRIQYAADDWLFIQSFQFLIDGMTFNYTPNKVERDNKSTIWEWSDEQVSSFDMSLINALYSAKSAKVRCIGKQYHKDRVLTKNELESIRKALDLYRAMKGRI